jgi:hypothetical protein
MSAFGQSGVAAGYGSGFRQRALQSQGQMDPYGNQVRNTLWQGGFLNQPPQSPYAAQPPSTMQQPPAMQQPASPQQPAPAAASQQARAPVTDPQATREDRLRSQQERMKRLQTECRMLRPQF